MSSVPSPQIHNHLFSFAGIEGKVVLMAPCHSALHLTPARYLITINDQALDSGVISTPDDGVALIGGSAVMCEEFVEQGAQHTTLRAASVHD